MAERTGERRGDCQPTGSLVGVARTVRMPSAPLWHVPSSDRPHIGQIIDHSKDAIHGLKRAVHASGLGLDADQAGIVRNGHRIIRLVGDMDPLQLLLDRHGPTGDRPAETSVYGWATKNVLNGAMRRARAGSRLEELVGTGSPS